MANILAVGIATLDIVNTLDDYPQEDTEVRALSQRVSRGGNATNTLVVLRQLGHDTAWAGVWVDEPDGMRIHNDLVQHGVDLQFSRRLEHGKVPTSYILLSRRTGSRTIVHYRDLPEFGLEEFRTIPLEPFQWIHFEGRHVADTLAMLHHARRVAPRVRRSLEVEKPRPGIESLWPYVDVLLFSPAYAGGQGLSPAALLHSVRQRAPQADLYCTAGAAGAVALAPTGELLRSPASAPDGVVDTLGAGDTFNAAVIDGYLRGLELGRLLNRACAIAGAKVGRPGLDALPLGPWLNDGV